MRPSFEQSGTKTQRTGSWVLMPLMPLMLQLMLLLLLQGATHATKCC
jgi:hypothetical protein